MLNGSFFELHLDFVLSLKSLFEGSFFIVFVSFAKGISVSAKSSSARSFAHSAGSTGGHLGGSMGLTEMVGFVRSRLITKQ